MTKHAFLCVAISLSLIGCSKKPDAITPAAAAPAPSDQVATKAPDAIAPSAPTPPATVVAAPAAPDVPKVPLLADLSTDQVTSGLKEALSTGLQAAVTQLGKPGGFLNDPNVKIPMPQKLQSVETALRAVGQGALADQFVTTMNQAAEQAVPAAASVFSDSLRSMTVDDAKKILTGPDDAATQYFRQATQADLTQKFLPIVKQATSSCGATAAYKELIDKAKSAVPFFIAPSLDLDTYVTSKAMDGLFTMVAAQEKQIRQNPVARSTDLLKSVFGALKN